MVVLGRDVTSGILVEWKRVHTRCEVNEVSSFDSTEPEDN